MFELGEKVIYYWAEKEQSFYAIIMKRLRVSYSMFKYELQLMDYQGGGWSVTAYEHALKKIIDPNDVLKELLV